MKKFYVASSFKNIEAVRYVSKQLIDRGYIHTYDWTRNNRASTFEALKEIGQKEKAAVMEADVVIVLLPAGKGSHIEMGIALGLGKRVYLYSPNGEVDDFETTSTFYHLPEVQKCIGSLEDLIEEVMARELEGDLMGKYEVKQISNLLDIELDDLVTESKQEGFRFVERLINDYKNGNNTFSYAGEGLFGVFSEEGTLIAIGGLNQDPFSNEQEIGRLRRFYVRKAYRRHGIGSFLVKRIMDEANKHYQVLVLHTDTEQGDQFYSSIGFSKGELYPNSSHYIDCKQQQAQS